MSELTCVPIVSACRFGSEVHHLFTIRLIHSLNMARKAVSYLSEEALAKMDILILDDELHDHVPLFTALDVLVLFDDHCGNTSTEIVLCVLIS